MVPSVSFGAKLRQAFQGRQVPSVVAFSVDGRFEDEGFGAQRR
jgi:hypothetical protein